MTTTPAPPSATEQPATRDTRRFTWHGVRTVMTLELRQRVRSTRWKIALIAWFALVALISVLLPSVVGAGFSDDGGTWIFGLILLFVLGLGLLVSPTLASTSINGDRNAGTLAIIQVTMLGPAEIAVGKLLASWAAALAFLVISLPFLVWAAVIGSVPAGGFLLVIVVLALLLGVVCGIGLGMSSLTTRTAGSSVLTYVAVASLTVISLILFLLSLPAVTSRDQVDVLMVPNNNNGVCEWVTSDRSVVHTERTWWLLAINPFVVLADAAPAPRDEDRWSTGPLTAIQEGVRLARAGDTQSYDECWSGNYPPGFDPYGDDRDGDVDSSPIWPWGLAANLALGAGGLWLAIRRLSVPYKTLSQGTRVA